MLSFRVLAAAAVLATVAALPATDKPIPRPVTTITDADFDDAPWFSFPLFGNLFAPLWKLFPTFTEVGPRIIADDKTFQIIVNVKDFKKDDLKVKVKGDFIFVQGSHEAKQDDHDIFASQFFHTYSLPSNASSADVTAELSSDGYLVVRAPISGARTKNDSDREVAITETGAPYNKEESTTTVVKDVVKDTEDRKEPTTPAEDVTEKDNIIPHGTDKA